MNEFTKEELQDIYKSLEADQSMCCVDNIIMQKIQSLIENHCEHRWTSMGNCPWLHCFKCRRNFYYE